jgi:PadR family transcriptional regulator AphA
MDVRTLCLGVLTERAMSGYEIKKHFEEAFRHFFLAGYGSIYPALAELAREGLVTVESVEQEKRPDKKVYRITELGWAELQRELMMTRPQHRVRSEFLALMYFAHLLPPARVAQLIDERIAEWERNLYQDIARFEREAGKPGAAPLTPGQRFGLGYGSAVLTAALAYVRRQRGPLLREIEALQVSEAAAAE